MRLNGQLQADYDYDAVNNLTQTTFGNGTQETRQYDDLNRLKQLEDWQGTTQLASYAYTLDKVGNRTQVNEFQNGESRTLSYTYDDLYRLTKEVIDAAATQNDLTQEYRYDPVGNRLSKTVNGVTTNYTYDNSDRLLNETVNGAVTVSYTYDNNGSTLTKTEASGTTTYTWDDEKRLIAATVNGQPMQYRYNDQGIRVSSTVNGMETRYLLNEGAVANVWEEYSPTGQAQVAYAYGNDLISQTQGGESSFYLVDGLGSTCLLTDAQGTVLNTYRYDVRASDADGDRLRYSLDTESIAKGMAIDELGRLVWIPKQADLGVTHAVTIAVTDEQGAATFQTFLLTVAPDTQQPQVTVFATQDVVEVGATVTFVARATDNVQLAGLTLVIDGQAVGLDANGWATVTLNQAKDITAIATAFDAAGNQTAATTTIHVINPNATFDPNLDFDLPDVVTAPTQFKVDGEGVVGYKLEVAPVAGGEWRTLAEKQAPIAPNELATFDPSLLENDTYTTRLTLYGANGDVAFIEDTVSVAGDLKLGNFRLSFTDLSIPVTGIPISLTRTYDTLTANTSDDFGYGWRMEFRDTDLRTSLKRTPEQAELGVYPAFKDGTRVYITLPGGKREGFTFKPTGDRFNSFFGNAPDAAMYHPAFNADKGITDTLTVRDTRVVRSSDTNQYAGLAGNPYNPADPTYGGVYVLTTKEGIIYEIDAQTGDLLTVTDTNGNKLTYTDEAITSSTGQKITFERDAQNRITSVKDPLGELVRYEYDVKGDLVSVTDQEQNETQFIYDTDRSHYLKEIIDPLRRTGAKTEYDNNGRLKQVVNGANIPINIEYKPEESVQIVKDFYGNPTVYRYDDRGNVLQVTDALGHSTYLEYDDDNNVILTRDANDLVTKFTYDKQGNLTAKTESYCGCPGVVPGTTYYTYDRYGQMTSLVLPTGASITTSYDLAGNLLAMKDGLGNVIQSYTYGPHGEVWSETDTTGTSTYEYDAAGNVIKSTGAGNKSTLMRYFADGKLKQMIEDNGTPNDLTDDQVSTFTYDKLGREKRADYGNGIYVEYGYEGSGGDWMTLDAPTIGHLERKMTADGKLAGWVTANGGTPTFIYDQAGRLWQETDASGNITTEYGYDAAGRLISTKDVRTGAIVTKQYDAGNRVTEEVDPLGGFTRYEYNAPREGGKLKSVTLGKYVKDATGNWDVDPSVALQTTSYEYNGLTTTVTDSLGRKTSSRMDEYSLPTETIFQQRDGQDYRTSASYLYANNLQEAKDYPMRMVDIGGNDRVFTYDDLGRLKTATDLGDGVYSYSYGDDGLALITGPTGETLGYGYDDMGNLARVTYGDGSSKTLAYYETDNRLKSMTLAGTETIAYAYDAAGRLNQQTTSTGLTTGFTYDANGNVKTVTDSTTGTTTYTYEPVTNRLSQIEYGNGSSIAYTYDFVGRMQSQTEKGSLTGIAYKTEYDYDAFGNLNWVKDPSGGITTMKYDVGNRMTERNLPNGVKTTWDYDDLDRVKSITHTNAGGEVLASVTYERQGIGQPTRITREDGTYVKLQYDTALRVTKESYYNASNVLVDETEYVYDAAGKRMAQVTELGRQAYTYTAGYQLDTITASGEVEDYDYDANGRLTAMQRDGQTLDLEHDVYDRLTEVENETTGTTTRYVYDSAGRRVAATEGTNQRLFLVTPAMGSGLESTDLMTDGAGNLISNYIYAGGSSPFMRLDANGNPVYYLTDGMGSVIGLADGAGASSAKFGYDAFGNVRSSQGVGADSAGGDFRFQGQWLESATGLYNFRARDYDARTGTFLSRDPVDPISTEPESFNPYQFEYNNPFVYSDPTGMFTILEVNATQAVQNGLQNARTYALRELKEKAIESVQDFAADFAVSALRSILPIDIPGYLKNFSNIPVRQGNLFEAVARGALCQILTSIGADDWMWNEPKIKPDGRGTPVRPGYRCSNLGDIAAMRRGMYGGSRGNFPDFLFKQEEPTDTSSRGYLIGDFKRSTETVYKEIKDPNNTQWKAIKGYAQNQQYIPVVAFVTYIHDKKKVKVSQLRKEFIEQGIIATVESFVNGKGKFF